MSTLTGNDVMGLMEAYQAVYAPQELTEEQVWEEVETWVNDLIEEGYDLSDYTWEEMFESYLEELTVAQKNTKIKSELNAANAEVVKRGGVAGSIGRGLTSMFGNQKDIDKNTASDKASDARIRQAGAASVGKYYSSSDGKTYANYNDAKAARNSRLKAGSGSGGSGSGGSGSGGNRLPSTKPPAAAKPAPTPAGPTKPAIGTTAGGTKFERRAATGAELRAAQAARAAAKAAGDTKGAEEAAVKAGVEAGKSASKPAVTSRPSGFGVPTAPLAAKLSATTSTASPTPTAAPKAAPPPPKKETAPQPPKTPISSSYEYDAYDLVLEYLLSQGHADTLEEANYVMLELDAEMIGDIVEVMTPPPIMSPPPVKAPPKTSEGKKVPQITGDGKGKPMGGPYKD